jgi:hypothetical protein
MSNTKAIGVAYLDQDIDGADIIYSDREIGYTALAQGAVTQATSKATAVTLNKSAGRITLNNAALGAGAAVSFTLNNSFLSVNDTVILTISGKATGGPALADPLAYTAYVTQMTAGAAVIVLRNLSAASQSEDVIINFAVLHCV